MVCLGHATPPTHPPLIAGTPDFAVLQRVGAVLFELSGNAENHALAGEGMASSQGSVLEAEGEAAVEPGARFRFVAEFGEHVGGRNPGAHRPSGSWFHEPCAVTSADMSSCRLAGGSSACGIGEVRRFGGVRPVRVCIPVGDGLAAVASAEHEVVSAFHLHGEATRDQGRFGITPSLPPPPGVAAA